MSLPELALRFILSNKDVSTVIPGMRRAAHVEQNLAASDGHVLTAEQLARVRRHRWVRDYVVM
jgi:aryl-alcohol dehydrogenase-like predicted oxidoreductase